MIKSVLRRRSRHDRALDLLDRERSVLLEGPMNELAAIVAEREALLGELLADAAPPPEGFLASLKMRAERNGRLLLASLAGLRAARDQVEEADQASRSLRTYTAEGTSVDVAESRSTHDHRR